MKKNCIDKVVDEYRSLMADKLLAMWLELSEKTGRPIYELQKEYHAICEDERIVHDGDKHTLKGTWKIVPNIDMNED